MESVTLIIDAEKKAREKIEEARKKADNIKKEIDKEGSSLLRKVEKEIEQELSLYEEELEKESLLFAEKKKQVEEEINSKHNQLWNDKKEELINGIWKDFNDFLIKEES